MRIALIILIGIHGIIHVFGFLKAFGVSEFNAINQPISKTSGLFWLVSFLLFCTALMLLLIRSDYWWLCGWPALITSQILIFSYWSDAKYGTIANLIILLASILAYSNYHFNHQIKKERTELSGKSEETQETIVHDDDITLVPEVVQRWLKHSGIIGKPKVENVYLIQNLELKLKPEQTDWNKGTAEQYFSIQPPAFNWNIDTEISPLLRVVGRDKFQDGKGEMLIKLLSLIPVVDTKGNEKVNQATLQRYLSEVVWFPSAALSDYIKWEEINENSARAIMEFNGTKGEGIFYFDEKGQFQKFIAMRFKDANDTEPMEWVVNAFKTEERNGVKIPTECEVSWNLPSEQWTWLKLQIRHIDYNVKKIPVPDNYGTVPMP